MTSVQRNLDTVLAMAPVIPVLIIDDVATAAPLAKALVAGGLPVLEVTLRTSTALDVIRAMREVEGAVVGAGTILTPAQVEEAVEAGAQFLVSPGSSPGIIEEATAERIPLLPGAATATEAMSLFERGYGLQKFFPAEAAGGVRYLESLASPLPMIRFCPTGGISARNAGAYLALKNVACVGGSWVAPKDAIAAGDWERITGLAREAAGLRG